MSRLRVVGYVMSRDEWPLLALTLTHALTHHVDHVVVLDHASQDRTPAGLQQLSRKWPGHLTLLRLDDTRLYQEAATTLVSHVAGLSDYDWVYVFDADEFLLADGRNSLRDILAEVPADRDVVQYEVHNWVTPWSFDETDIGRYAEIRHRANPNVFAALPGEILAEEVRDGNMNYFDLPFPDKTIVRGYLADAIMTGAHGLTRISRGGVVEMPPDRLTAAHLPLLSRRRLDQKAQHGQALIDSGAPTSCGWQSQMLRHIQLTGQLDTFWAAHSVEHTPRSSAQLTPLTQEDDSLRNALEPSIAKLAESERIEGDDITAGQVSQGSALFGSAVQAIRVQQEARDAARGEREEAVRAREAALRERDQAIQERDKAMVEREAALREREAALREREAALRERDVVVSSRTWRSTAWYRSLRATLRRRRHAHRRTQLRR